MRGTLGSGGIHGQSLALHSTRLGNDRQPGRRVQAPETTQPAPDDRPCRRRVPDALHPDKGRRSLHDAVDGYFSRER
jgi:hypothetical protein